MNGHESDSLIELSYRFSRPVLGKRRAKVLVRCILAAECGMGKAPSPFCPAPAGDLGEIQPESSKKPSAGWWFGTFGLFFS